MWLPAGFSDELELHLIHDYSSTCFERYFFHHQEHHNCIYSFWYYSRMCLPAGFMDKLELQLIHDSSSTCFERYFCSSSGASQLYLQLLLLFAYVAAGWIHGWAGTPTHPWLQLYMFRAIILLIIRSITTVFTASGIIRVCGCRLDSWMSWNSNSSMTPALHDSSDIFAHHQEHHNCIYSFWYYSRMWLPAGFIDEVELQLIHDFSSTCFER